jgi:hypothetical protein
MFGTPYTNSSYSGFLTVTYSIIIILVFCCLACSGDRKRP